MIADAAATHIVNMRERSCPTPNSASVGINSAHIVRGVAAAGWVAGQLTGTFAASNRQTRQQA
jgi:hypothetical protein